MEQTPSAKPFKGRVALLQRHLPSYRVDFVDTLAQYFPDGLHVLAGLPDETESKDGLTRLKTAIGHRITRQNLLGGRLTLFRLSGVTAALEACDPDVLVVEANPRIVNLSQPVRWMRRRQRPVAAWGIGTLTREGPLLSLTKHFRRRFFDQFDLLIGYGSRAAKQYSALGIPEDRLFVAHNSVVHRPSEPDPPARTIDRSRPVRLLFVGRLIPSKKLNLLLDACQRLPETLRPELTVVGDGPGMAAFEAYAANTFPQAKFTGALHGADLADQFRAADLFVLPGPGGLAIQEAMSYALPVMVAEADGTQDDLVRPSNGWQLVPDDVDDLTRKLTEAMSDRERLVQMGQASYRIIHDEINLNTMATKFVTALHHLKPRG